MDENVEFTAYVLISSLLLAASHHSTLKRKGALSRFCCFWFIHGDHFCCSPLSCNKQYAMPLGLKLVTCCILCMYSSSSWKRNAPTTLSWKPIPDFGIGTGAVSWDIEWPDTWPEPICGVLLGLYFRYCTVPQSRELCNGCGLWWRGTLGRAGSRRSRSCWIHSPQLALAPRGGHRNQGVMAEVSRLSASAKPGQKLSPSFISEKLEWQCSLFLWRICGPIQCLLYWFQWNLSTYSELRTGALRRESFLKWGQTCILYRASSDPGGHLRLLRDSEGIFLIVLSLVLFSGSAK